MEWNPYQPIEGSPGDYSGYSVSLNKSGSVAAIGAPNSDSNAGIVRVYTLNSGTWSQIGNNIEGEAVNGKFGYSVSLDEDGVTVAIGAPNSNSDAGSVRVYKFNSGLDNWEPIGETIEGSIAGGKFGYSVSLDGDGGIVAIGAPNSDSNAGSVNAGSVRIYKLNSALGIWQPIGGTIGGIEESGFLGYSVSLNGDGTTLAIGAPGNSIKKGYTRVYKLDGSTWEPVGPVINGAQITDFLGYSVSLNGDGTTLAIGAPGNYTYPGYTSVYKLTGTIFNDYNWVQLGETINGTVDNRSGFSVSLNEDGTIVAIGSPSFNPNKGYTDVYKLNGSNWEPLGQVIYTQFTDAEIYLNLGYSVSLNGDGTIVAIGIPYVSSTSIYELITTTTTAAPTTTTTTAAPTTTTTTKDSLCGCCKPS